jgi:hypothetical protein
MSLPNKRLRKRQPMKGKLRKVRQTEVRVRIVVLDVIPGAVPGVIRGQTGRVEAARPTRRTWLPNSLKGVALNR